MPTYSLLRMQMISCNLATPSFFILYFRECIARRRNSERGAAYRYAIAALYILYFRECIARRRNSERGAAYRHAIAAL